MGRHQKDTFPKVLGWYHLPKLSFLLLATLCKIDSLSHNITSIVYYEKRTWKHEWFAKPPHTISEMWVCIDNELFINLAGVEKLFFFSSIFFSFDVEIQLLCMVIDRRALSEVT
jgi:hypothetical protein